MEFSFDSWGVFNEQGITQTSDMDINPPKKPQGVLIEPELPTEATEVVENLQDNEVIFHINIPENRMIKSSSTSTVLSEPLVFSNDSKELI